MKFHEISISPQMTGACSNAIRAANDFKMGARARSARMRPSSRLLQCVTMCRVPAAIGTKSFLLICVASLLHAKAIEPPLSDASSTLHPCSNLYPFI